MPVSVARCVDCCDRHAAKVDNGPGLQHFSWAWVDPESARVEPALLRDVQAGALSIASSKPLGGPGVSQHAKTVSS